MTRRSVGVLIALALGSCTIPVDRHAAESIPTDLAVTKLAEMLPKAWFVRCLESGVSIDQAEIQAWSVTKEGWEFRTSRKEPFRLSWTSSRGVELSKVLLRYEMSVFAKVPGDARKNVYTFIWKDEAQARRAAELFEALRGDR